MRLATRRDGSPDGELVVVSADGTRCRSAGPDWPNLLAAIERWDVAEPALRALAGTLDAGEGDPLDAATLAAPLPRSWQWLDGSAFTTHGDLMQIAFGMDPVPTDRPLMYQGISDRFYGPRDDVPFPDPALGIDFEGEFGVIVDAVPMGVSPELAAAHIKLIVQINDWSLRAVAPIEMKTGFGWVQAKPPCSVAPFAVTPDSLGADWHDGRVAMDLLVDWNGARFGAANGAEMLFGFPELIAHAARTRDLVAGTIIGSGTVSNRDAGGGPGKPIAEGGVGYACIAEQRSVETIRGGAATTPFLKHGDTVRIWAEDDKHHPIFGVIEQTVGG